MKIIFHIRTEETGITSIQRALSTNADFLTQKGTHSLGMWFDIINPKYRGDINLHYLFSKSAGVTEIFAGKFLDELTVLSKK